MKDVKRADSSDNSICQNPEFASGFVKTWALAIWAKICSTAGNWWHSQHTFSLGFVRSTQIPTWPLALGTTTIPIHHSVGFSTREVTPSLSMQSSSFRTCCISGMGTLSLMVYSCSILPSPVKSCGKSCSTLDAPLSFNIPHPC